MSRRSYVATMEAEEHSGGAVPPVKNLQKAKAVKKRGQEPMRHALYRMSGVSVKITAQPRYSKAFHHPDGAVMNGSCERQVAAVR
jgi:hypothetical protein